MKKLIKDALIHSTLTTLYIILVASFIYSLQIILPEDTKNILIPIAMLLLLVFSAALMGILIFGKPIMLYLDNKKKESISLISYTLLFLFIITFIVFMLLITYSNFF